MTRLITTTPVGKNGQTVVPIEIRRLFKLHSRFGRVGWFAHNDRIEVAPVEEKKTDYSPDDLEKIRRLARAKGGKVFKTSQAAKKYLDTL